MNHTKNHSDQQGVIYKKSTGIYFVHANGQVFHCSLSPRFHNNGKSSREKGNACLPDVIAVGDTVEFIRAEDGNGIITGTAPRRNRLARRAAAPMPSSQAAEQVIAANIDQVVAVMAAAEPRPKWNLLDRYLVSAEASDLPALIFLTKLDLAQDAAGKMDGDIQAVVDDYRRIGYPIVTVSAITGEGIDEVRDALRNRVSVMIGKSGAGKTSLLNALQPELGLRVNEVSRATGKGKHTTTHIEMFPLESGGAIVDTPGTREFGLWDVTAGDLAYFFPEMQPYVGGCRFGLDCQHDDEPGCAIRKAVMEETISPWRYQSFLRLKDETHG